MFSMNCLATVCRELKEFENAEVLYKECLAARETHLGEDHPETLRMLSSLAILYSMTGKFDDCAGLLIKCIQLRVLKLGTENSETVAAIRNLHILYTCVYPQIKEGAYRETIQAILSSHSDLCNYITDLENNIESDGLVSIEPGTADSEKNISQKSQRSSNRLNEYGPELEVLVAASEEIRSSSPKAFEAEIC